MIRGKLQGGANTFPTVSEELTGLDLELERTLCTKCPARDLRGPPCTAEGQGACGRVTGWDRPGERRSQEGFNPRGLREEEKGLSG